MVEPLTDFPEKFEERRRLTALLADGSRCELELDHLWPHGRRLVFKFSGVDSISEAESLAGAELQIRLEQRAELKPGAAYVGDLIGCRVCASQGGAAAEDIGSVTEVMFGAGSAPLLIIRDPFSGRERMVPFAEEYIGRLDLGQRLIELKLPQGMLDLDAPLSQEEKDEQHRKH